ncbi:hypothetical protein KVR01_008332 [Diaporthe batatas]|uniref:uncharacterized protein n=1 Tax=Diaporthe batatas TaxID=748121 RepID=UPI001D03B94A|nr:uncharacterized protein KVR01_008332 [Diaporthe batatas]KAG8162567.1 hypothetical protein KVR01_008332 [Diaporthe batatas]
MAKPQPNLEELPEEIILHILRMVHDTPIPDFHLRKWGYQDDSWFEYDQSTRDIQNVRLTSRSLSRIGSELLIEYVGLDLSLESLTRFQTIMAHPGIRKGVGMIRIRLPAYQWHLCVEEMTYEKKKLDVGRIAICLGPEGETPASLCSGWRDCPQTPDEVKAAIEQSRREYRKRFQAQQRFLKDPQDFLQGVSNALKMSNNKAIRVEFTDMNDLPQQFRFRQSVERAEVENHLDLLLRAPLSPRPWCVSAYDDGNEPEFHQGLAPLILHILAAFADERINIVSLKLRISSVNSSDRKVLGKMESELGPVRGACTAMRNLRRFKYLNMESTNPLLASEGGTHRELSTLLYRCLPPSLRVLELWGPTDLDWLRCRLPSLTQITLDSLEVRAEGLEPMLRWLQPHETDITLRRCHNEIATWDAILDLLRSKQRNTRLIQPSGLEFGLAQQTGRFSSLYSPEERANRIRVSEQYIRGDLDTNPFRPTRKS